VEVFKLEMLGVGDDGGRVCMAGDHACVALPQAVISAWGAVTSMYPISVCEQQRRAYLLHVSLSEQTRREILLLWPTRRLIMCVIKSRPVLAPRFDRCRRCDQYRRTKNHLYYV
jgi:hypothetical protein